MNKAKCVNNYYSQSFCTSVYNIQFHRRTVLPIVAQRQQSIIITVTNTDKHVASSYRPTTFVHEFLIRVRQNVTQDLQAHVRTQAYCIQTCTNGTDLRSVRCKNLYKRKSNTPYSWTSPVFSGILTPWGGRSCSRDSQPTSIGKKSSNFYLKCFV